MIYSHQQERNLPRFLEKFWLVAENSEYARVLLALTVPFFTLVRTWLVSRFLLILLIMLGCTTESREKQQEEKLMDQVVWDIDNLNFIGGHPVKVVGSPRVIVTPAGKAIEFDGVGDALFIDVHPLSGVDQFTVEVIFKPYLNGPKEQRFFHMQENDSQNRVMFETRLTENNLWFLDAFIKSGEGNHVLYAEEFKHPIGSWYHAAIVVDGKTMRHYVNGVEEMRRPIVFIPQMEGQTSLGVRINKVHWYKGAIRKTRFTPQALLPEMFLEF